MITLREDFPLVYNNKGNTLAKLNNISEAVQFFDMAVELSDDYGIALLNRGFVKELMGDLNGACEDWSKAAELGVEGASDYLTECDQ